MPNITVSSSSNFDDPANLALDNNQQVTVTSGATLTINSDTRYAQNSAAPQTITISQGVVIVDGTEVWWIPFDASSGNVPALDAQGTLNVTVGGVDVGELLGVWDAYAVPKPLVAGVAMPASGYIKLRRKVAAIADNDVLTFGNGATATVDSATGGQRGWIDLCGTTVYTANFSTGGIYCNARSQLRVQGDWFELGMTTGVAGQVLQHYLPIYCSGVQIETAPASGVYEWYASFPFNNVPSATVGTNLNNSMFGRLFTSTTTGQITLGYNSQFYVPPAGCRIRVPNICLTSVLAGSYDTYATTLVDTQTWRLFGQDYADVEIDKLIIGAGRFHSRNTAKYYITNSTFMSGCMSWYMQLNPSSSKDWKFENIAVAPVLTSQQNAMLNVYGDKIRIKDAFFPVSASSFPYFYSSTNVDIENITIISWSLIGSGNTAPINISNCKDVKIKNLRAYAPGQQMFVLTNIENIDVDDVGIVNVDIVNSAYSGVGVGMSGTVRKARFNDFKAILGKMGGSGYDVMASLSGEEIIWSNWGSFSAPYDVNNSTSYRNRTCPQYAWNNGSVKKQSLFNIWLSSVTGSELYVMASTSTDIIYNYCGQVHTVTPAIRNISPLYANSRLRNAVANISSGTEYLPYQHTISALDQTTSQIRFAFFVFPVADIRADDAVVSSGAERDGANLYLLELGDYHEITTDEILGVTALTTVGVTSTGSISVTYDIDTGTGFSGSYKPLNNTNIAAETVAATGFRLRVRAEATATGNNYLSLVTVNATTSSPDIQSNPYPIAEPNITVINVVSGSTLAAIRATDGKVLFITSAAGTSQVLRPGWSADVNVVFRVRKAGYSAFVLPYGLTYKDATIPINQEQSSVPATDPGALSISLTNHGATPVTWQSKQWSITITATGGETAAQIANFINYNLATRSRSFDPAFYNMQWPDMIVAGNDVYETARGTLYGSAGAALKGVRVVDGSGNEIPGFSRMQADDGTYYSPAASYTLTVAGIVSGSRLLLRRTDTGAVIANTSITGTTFTHTYVHTVDIPVEIVVRKATGSPAYQEWRTTTTLAASNNSQTANQLLDE